MAHVSFFARFFLKSQDWITRAKFVRTVTHAALLRYKTDGNAMFFFWYSPYARQKCLYLILCVQMAYVNNCLRSRISTAWNYIMYIIRWFFFCLSKHCPDNKLYTYMTKRDRMADQDQCSLVIPMFWINQRSKVVI